MNEETLKLVRAFEALPKTEEKAEICRQFNIGELCTLDFLSEIREYTNNQPANNTIDKEKDIIEVRNEYR